MRLVIFTALRGFESTPWWDVLCERTDIDEMLVVTERTPRRVLHSMRKNLRKHGPLWIPYRAGVLLRDTVQRLLPVSRPKVRTPLFTVTRLDVRSLADENAIEAVRAWRPDLGMSIGAPILKESLFSIPRDGTLNLHLGAVPEYRGAPPAFWELWHGATAIGATIHRVDKALDTGPVLTSARAPIFARDTLTTLRTRAEELGRIVLRRALVRYSAGPLTFEPQAAGGRTFRMPTLRQRLALARAHWARAIRVGFGSRNVVKSVGGFALLVFVAPIRDLLRTVRGTHPVRVFLYHRVTTLCRDGMTIHPAVFREQMQYLRRTHEVLSLEAAMLSLRSGARRRRPVAVVTFDDAYHSVFEHAKPVLDELGLTATVFATTGLVGTDQRFDHDDDPRVREFLSVMSWEELKTLASRGWTIGAHTHTHPRLAECDAWTTHRELLEPLALLRREMGITAPAFAYPFGGEDDVRTEQIREAIVAGYTCVMSNFGGENFIDPTTSGGTINRIDLGGDHPRTAWKAYARGFNLAGIRRRVGIPPATVADSVRLVLT